MTVLVSAVRKILISRAFPLAAVFCAALLLSGCSDKAGTPAAEPGMVFVPAGEYAIGSNKTDDENLQKEYGFVDPLYVNEHPLHKVYAPGFLIDQYEVSNAQYKVFVRAIKHPEPVAWIQNGYNVHDEKLHSFNLDFLRRVAVDYFKLDRDTTLMSREELLLELDKIQKSRDPLPVTSVNWQDAHAYCAWVGKRLPGEAEWEIAARGPRGWEYPWGNEFDLKKPNSGQGRDQENPTAPVGSYPGDKSPFGVHDMAGNVSEWVDDWYQPYPGASYHSKLYGQTQKVVRGSSAGAGHYSLSLFFRAALRSHMEPSAVSDDLGFRCTK